MTNKARGEVAVNINGETFTFVVTLKAMAEIEASTGKNFSDLAEDMSGSVSITSLLHCATAMARAGGASDVSAIENSQDVEEIANAVGEAISAAFAGSEPEKN
jgi:threonine dehydrogenase-like Zn-dependent dehydrogenase